MIEMMDMMGGASGLLGVVEVVPKEGLWSLLAALLALTVLEIVLGIDNVVFIAILASKLPAAQQAFARRIGLLLAMVGRIGLLLIIKWLVDSLKGELFSLGGHAFSGRDLILIGGGGFLLAKGTLEIHHLLEGRHAEKEAKAPSLKSVLIQILVMDLVFSLDSVITAVGMTDSRWVMITAIMLAIGIMMIFAGAISRFIERHPTMKTLALAFLILIGVLLVAEGLGEHFDRGYVYFAMAFSLVVEIINMKVRKRARGK